MPAGVTGTTLEAVAGNKRAIQFNRLQVYLVFAGQQLEKQFPNGPQTGLFLPEPQPSPVGDSGRETGVIQVSPPTPGTQDFKDTRKQQFIGVSRSTSVSPGSRQFTGQEVKLSKGQNIARMYFGQGIFHLQSTIRGYPAHFRRSNRC